MTVAAKRAASMAVLSLLWTLSRADTEVVCVLTDTCVLPCSFPSGSNAIINWTLATSGRSSVHAFDFDADHLELQDRRFQGRTSLFRDQISRGNASLRLTQVQVQDEGRYKCSIDTSHQILNSFVNMRVDAPVQKVDIRQEGDQIICSSEGIYPEPNLTWTTSHTSGVLTSTTIVQRGRQQLYNISSTLTASRSDLAYNCTVSTRSNRKTEVLKSQWKASEGIAIAQVVGVILVTVLMGLVPCFYRKCKKGNSRTNCSGGETKVV